MPPMLKFLPRETWRRLFTFLLRMLYRVEVTGLEHIAAAGPSAVIVANHQSYLDGPLLAVFLPGNPIFAIDPIAASRWWAKPLVSLVDVAELNPLQPMSVRHLIETVQGGRHCVIFPEGRLTQTGNLMKVYSGPAMIAGKSESPIIPVRIDGPQFSPLSYLKSILPSITFPKITIQILPPEMPPDTSHLAGHERRQAMTRNLYDLMARMIFMTQKRSNTLWEALLAAEKLYGSKTEVLEDANRNPMNYRSLITASNALAELLGTVTAPKERVGVLLPTGTAGVVSFFALQSIGRVTALLNFSAGPTAVRAALDAANINTVLTAHEFIDKGGLENVIGAVADKARIIYLEDLRTQITLPLKLRAAYRARVGFVSSRAKGIEPEENAVILFTSGSEGTPKGVALSHRNLMANVEQVRTIIAYSPQDTFFNAMPIFHAFGLTGGVLVPIFHGVKTFMHPSPLQYRVIPELIYHGNATIVFATDTFLTGWAKAADGYDFYSVRLVVSGAERLKPETYRLYSEKFGVPIYEGYGVTECSPALALNSPMHNALGTVGRFLPCVEYRLAPVVGIKDGSQLWVKGPNVMKGYFKADRPGILQPLTDGWYDTGDIVAVDEAGYIRIVGRAKRFAKIGGEMISLATVESHALACWPDAHNAAVSIPDGRKGEAIVLVTTEPNAKQDALARFMRTAGAVELSIPKEVMNLATIPALGSGKTDYVSLMQIVQEWCGEPHKTLSAAGSVVPA